MRLRDRYRQRDDYVWDAMIVGILLLLVGAATTLWLAGAGAILLLLALGLQAVTRRKTRKLEEEIAHLRAALLAAGYVLKGRSAYTPAGDRQSG